MNVQKHISAANKAFKKKHSITSLLSAYIHDGMCTVGDLFLQYSFPIKITGTGCIDWIELRAALKAGVTHGEIIIKEGEVAGVANIYCNTTLIELEASTHTDYPLITPGNLQKARVLPCNLLLTALKFVTPVEPDFGLVPLNGVHLSEGRVTACNRYIIYQRDTHQPTLQVNLDPRAVSMLQPCGQVTLEVEEVVKSLEQLKEEAEYALEAAEKEIQGDDTPMSRPEPKWIGPTHTVLKMEDAIIVSRNIDNTYPHAAGKNFRVAEQVSLNRRMITAALERLAPILTNTSKVKLSIKGYKAELSAEMEEPYKSAKVDLGEVITLTDFESYFNADYLALAMSTDPDEFLLGWSYIKGENMVYINGNLVATMRDEIESED